MVPSGRRILLSLEPGMLEGALARMLHDAGYGEVVEAGRRARDLVASGGDYDAAVVSHELPAGVRAGVVITLPDTRGSGGTGTVRRGSRVESVQIGDARDVVELLDRYVPRRSSQS